MKLFKSVASIAVVTLVALIYVHQQVELVKLSYSIETKEKKLKVMLDRKQRLNYNIDDLESPSRLEKVLMAKNIDVAFPGRYNVVRVAKTTSGSTEDHLRSSSIDKKFSIFGITDFLSPRAEAQARER
jgi:cell division protein FtsL